MLGISQTYSGKVTRDATGLPTGVSGVIAENVLTGTIKGVTAQFDDDSFVIGTGRLLATALVAYAGAQTANMRKGNGFAVNPWARA